MQYEFGDGPPRPGRSSSLRPEASPQAIAHHVDAFPGRFGPCAGTVDPYGLLDVRVRSTIPSVPGLSVNVTARNVLGHEHREFVGAPALGRRVITRFTYEFS